jgi:hypothetical protein
MNTKQLTGLAALAAVATACSGGSGHSGSTNAGGPAQVVASSTSSASTNPASNGPTGCETSSLSVKLGEAGGAAGSIYQPIVFTNTGSATCTLNGYPGVSFVAPGNGQQVGAAASRNPQHAPALVTLAPGASASATLQTGETGNYDQATCKPVDVSGLRVYPPGNTAAMYVAFPSKQQACSAGNVNQLSVEAVVAGATGM